MAKCRTTTSFLEDLPSKATCGFTLMLSPPFPPLLFPCRYYESRLAAIGHWHEVGIEAYPHKFHTTMRIPEFVEAFSSSVAIGETKEDTVVAIAGRVMSSRSASAKLQFYDIHGEGAKAQVMYNQAAAIKDGAKPETSSHPATGTLSGQAAYDWTVANVKRGDIIGELVQLA